MISDKIKETGWQTAAVGVGLGAFQAGLVMASPFLGLEETQVAQVSEQWEKTAPIILSMIFGGGGYRAIRMHQKRTQERIAEDAQPPALEDEEEGPWD